MPKTIKELDDAAKDRIIAAAVDACQWVGWAEDQPDPRPGNAIRQLKSTIERETGQEIMEYT